jgi:hypothetical protein
VPWTDILQKAHGIVSIFGLDLDTVFSLQCLLGFSQRVEQIWILSLPIPVALILFIVSKVLKLVTGKTTRWMASLLVSCVGRPDYGHTLVA